MSGGTMNRMLEVDLTSGSIETKRLDRQDLELYLGGRGLGVRLLYDHTAPGLDPYDEKMALIFSAGPLVGTSAPQSNRFVVTTKSPLTGGIGDSHCGGNFATKLKKAGYDAVLIRGRAPKPVFLQITDEEVAIKDAAHLWGEGTRQTQEALPDKFGMAVIGPAGENLVRYACIVSQTRVAGRTGIGAVMGSKNLKAIIANGKQKIPIAQPEAYKKLQQEITKFLAAHPMTGGILPELGTANLVMTTAGRNIIPTRNFQAGQDTRTPQLSGEKMRDELLVKRDGCLACPIRCGRHVKIVGRETKGPEFETIGMLGNNLGIFDLTTVTELGELCDDLGMDTISMGNTLGFATELTERGLLESNLSWGKVEAYRQAIEDTAQRKGIGAELAEGTRRMADHFGGHGFAIHAKGLELPAYDPRGCVGQGLEYATTNRGGCHIRGSTMYMEATGPVSIDPHSPRSKPELVVLQQNTNAAISSLSMCYFSSYAMIPDFAFTLDPNSMTYRLLMGALLNAMGPVLRLMFKFKNPAKVVWFEKFLSTVSGRDVSMGELNEIGDRIFNLERLYNLREGIDDRQDALPSRLLNEPLPADRKSGVPLREMLPTYYRIRGWDDRGVPTERTIRRLQIRT
jgi:aldehyde:ferredoxin oxidoreductase